MSLCPARTVRCVQCGGAIAIGAPGSAPICPYCHHAQPVPQALGAELSRYRVGFDVERAKGAEHDRARTQWDRWYGGQTPGGQKRQTVLLIVIVYVAFPVVAAALFMGAQALGVRGEDTKYVSFLLLGLLFTSVLGWQYVAYVRRQRSARPKEVLANELLACPMCGAPHAFEAGAVDARCRHCQAPILPSPIAMAHAIDAAKLARRRAAMARHRSERHAMRVLGASATFNGRIAVWWSLGLVGGGLIVAMTGATIDALGNPRLPTTALPTLGLVWMVMLAAAIVAVLVLQHRRRLRARWKSAIARVAEQLGGESLSGVDASIAWLDAYWPAPFSITSLMVGRSYQAAAGIPHGFPCLVHVDPMPMSTKGSAQEARIDVLVAANVPNATETSWPAIRPETAAILSGLEHEGFAIHLHDAGLMAHATPPLLAIMRKAPERAALLASVGSRLSLAAQTMGGTPAPPFDG